MDEDELTTCPHCGGRSQLNWSAIGKLVLHFVQCVRCGATGGKSRDKQLAKDMWEERV